MDARTIDNLELADPSAETRNLIARWRDIVKRGVIRQSGGRWKKHHEPRFLRHERRIIEEQLQIAIRNIDSRQADQPQGFQPQERRNSGPLLEGGPPTTPTATTRGRARTVLKTNTTGPYGRRRIRIGNGPRPVSTGGPGSQLGLIRGRQERPMHEKGPRAESGRRRTKPLGSEKCRQGNGKAVCHRPAIAHYGDNKRPMPPQNARLLRETTARQNARRILSIQKEAINQIRTGFLRGQNNSPKALEDNFHQPLAEGTPSHKQNVDGGKTLLVATDY